MLLVDNEIKRLKEANDILQSKLETKYDTPIRPQNANYKTSSFRAAEILSEFHIMFLELLKQEKC